MAAEDAVPPLCPNFNVIPSRETEVADFLRDNPTCDGRGIVMAILDTGVDPSAPGMQVTSNGQAKVVDIVDCTGAGDVDTSVVRYAQDGVVVGLTGRKLQIPSTWKNPSGKYNLGVKAIYELYPESLKKRVKEEKKRIRWTPVHRLAIADLNKQIELFERNVGSDTSKMALTDRLKKENLDAGMKVLKELESNYEDCGPTADCIVFHDGTSWVACLDTTFSGDLSKCKLMASYKLRKEFDILTELDMMAYSFNIHASGCVLEIACTSGLHGTHVACIAAACFPDAPHRNGIAPGAQIVSLQIGDGRLDTLETGTALLRAITYCVENGIKLINYSYAEPVNMHNTGKIIEAINDAVINHQIIYIGSSGNNGPCLSTVTSPGGSCSTCIGVAAYVSPAMRTKLYSLRDSVAPMLYPWSSRGPCPDGWIGATVCAPGAAITSTPSWTLHNCQLLNGTSMSSPHVAGAVALLMSALNSKNIPFSPSMIRLALANTARKVEQYSIFEQGNGLLQVQKAYDYLLRCAPGLKLDMHYKATVDDSARGVHLRELYEVEKAREVSVAVEPVFSEQTKPQVRFEFNKVLALTCDQDWVKIPTHLQVSSASRAFRMRFDPRRLDEDCVHYAEVAVFESDNPAIGPVLRIPVTVIKPVRPNSEGVIEFNDVTLPCRGCARHFVHVPEGCNVAVIQVRGRKFEKASQFVLHVVQLLPDQSYRQWEWYKLIRFNEKSDFSFTVPLHPDRTMELCAAGWWSNSGDLAVDCKVSFSGLVASPTDICWPSYEPVLKISAKCGVASEELQPVMCFNNLCIPLNPSKNVILNLGPRDLYIDCQQCYQLQLTYEFYLDQLTTVTPVIPLLSEYLYEAEYCGFLWTIYNAQDRYMLSGSYFSNRYQGKLPKGSYTLVLQVRHTNEEMLEEIKELGILLSCRLVTSIQVRCFPNLSEAISGGAKKFGSRRVTAHSLTPLYFVGPTKDSLPKNLKAGCYLRGSLVLHKGDARNVPQVLVQYHIPYSKGTKLTKKKKIDFLKKFNLCESLKSPEWKGVQDAVDAMKATLLKDLSNANGVLRLYQELVKGVAGELRALMNRLNLLLNQGVKGNEAALRENSEGIFRLVSLEQVLQFLGSTNDYVTCGQIKEDMEEKRLALIIAYYARGLLASDSLLKSKPINLEFIVPEDSEKLATGQLANGSGSEASKPAKKEADPEPAAVSYKLSDVDDAFASLVKLGVSQHERCAMFFVKHAYLHDNIYQAIRIVRRCMEENCRSRRLAELEIELFKEVGLVQVISLLQDSLLVDFPPTRRPL